ncbi:MAG TPA: RNB domain-containing ribonuclease [Gemmatimonadaceae bacterium]|nr:RNB domain-containing ribonuclease [Gemmatimonadaceae bacterium]
MLTEDLRVVARQAMIDAGFSPDYTPEMNAELQEIGKHVDKGTALRDMRRLLWSSIDNDDTRDLDQIEYAEESGDGSWRLVIAIADVDSEVPAGSAIDQHAAAQTTTVYTGAVIFPMIPTELSTGATSLFANTDRKAVVIDMSVNTAGTVAAADIYRANVRNCAQLAYNAVGDWLDHGATVPSEVTAVAGLEPQLRLQAKIAAALRQTRLDNGALEIETVEARAVSHDGQVTAIEKTQKNSATDLIEDFMIAANGSVARFLEMHHVSGIRRIVRSPERWDRIVDLAKQYGTTLPDSPDPVALHNFMLERRQVDAEHFPDLSLAIVKLLGPGEYILDQPGVEEPGHFGLAVQDYTHSTAPNRRYADLVTQRIVKAVLASAPPPYTDEELSAIARNCTLKEDAARKVEREVRKIAAAMLFSSRIGQRFSAIVTGKKSTGTFVRVVDPPVEGMLVRGEHGVDVGDEIEVQLLSTNVRRGFIDFGRVGSTPTPNPPGKKP